jgi:hypothetical protein
MTEFARKDRKLVERMIEVCTARESARHRYHLEAGGAAPDRGCADAGRSD